MVKHCCSSTDSPNGPLEFTPPPKSLKRMKLELAVAILAASVLSLAAVGSVVSGIVVSATGYGAAIGAPVAIIGGIFFGVSAFCAWGVVYTKAQDLYLEAHKGAESFDCS